MAGGGTYRGIYTKLLDDPDYQKLSPEARLVLLTLRLCSQNNAACIFRPYAEVIRSQTGYSAEVLGAALAELQRSPSPDAPWIFREDPVVWVRNGLRYDPNMHLSDRKHRKAVERALDGLPKLLIVENYREYYRITRPIEGPYKAHRRPIEGVNQFGSPSRSRSKSTKPPLTPPESPPPEKPPPIGRQADGSFRLRDSMFHDCAEGRAGLCVRSEFLSAVPVPRQCAVHRGNLEPIAGRRS